MGQPQGETPHFSAVRVREADELRQVLTEGLGDSVNFDDLIDFAGRDVPIFELALGVQFFVSANNITAEQLAGDDPEAQALLAMYGDEAVVMAIISTLVPEDQLERLGEMLELLGSQLSGE